MRDLLRSRHTWESERRLIFVVQIDLLIEFCQCRSEPSKLDYSWRRTSSVHSELLPAGTSLLRVLLSAGSETDLKWALPMLIFPQTVINTMVSSVCQSGRIRRQPRRRPTWCRKETARTRPNCLHFKVMAGDRSSSEKGCQIRLRMFDMMTRKHRLQPVAICV